MNELEATARWLETLDFSAWRFAKNAYSLWLKLRDSDPFDSECQVAFLEVNEQERDKPLSHSELKILAHIHHTSFSKTVEATGNTELATCVSDDFELLARAARIGLETQWLKALQYLYAQERFPFGTLCGL